MSEEKIIVDCKKYMNMKNRLEELDKTITN